LTRGVDVDVDDMNERFAYWDREADIAWIPTAPTVHVVCEKTSWGLVDHDVKTGEVTALEIWDASKVFPAEMLERLPAPGRPDRPAAAA
jgi:uncharacterized protein YuzE